MVKLVNPQEIIVWDIIPFLRKELTLSLIKKDSSQKEVAAILGITPAAVSQYLSSKRARKIKLEKNILKEIDKSAEYLKKNESTALEEIQRLVALPEIRELACKIHKNEYGADKDCNICLQ